MSKSTQDLCIFINQLEQHLDERGSLSIQVFSNKAFRIYHSDHEDYIYDSEEQEYALDINDLCYEDSKDFADFLAVLLQDNDAPPASNPADAADDPDDDDQLVNQDA